MIRGIADAGIGTFRRFAQVRRGANGIAPVVEHLPQFQVGFEGIRRKFDGLSQVVFSLRGIAVRSQRNGKMGIRERRRATDRSLEMILRSVEIAMRKVCANFQPALS